MVETSSYTSNSDTSGFVYLLAVAFQSFIRRDKTILLLIMLLVVCSCRVGEANWIRSLPEEKSKTLSPSQTELPLAGTWVRNTHPRSPFSSPWLKNQWRQSLTFYPNTSSFEKIYINKDYYGDTLEFQQIVGRGSYQVQGHWILLKTDRIAETTKPDSELHFESYSHKLLYHYDPESDTLIPLSSDTAYFPRVYGILDEIHEPYKEDRFFWIARRHYAVKKYQSHLYSREVQN